MWDSSWGRRRNKRGSSHEPQGRGSFAPGALASSGQRTRKDAREKVQREAAYREQILFNNKHSAKAYFLLNNKAVNKRSRLGLVQDGGERDTADAQGDERAATCSFSRGSFLKFFSIKPPAMRRWLIIGVGWREGIVKVVRRASPVYDGKGIPGRIAPLPK